MNSIINSEVVKMPFPVKIQRAFDKCQLATVSRWHRLSAKQKVANKILRQLQQFSDEQRGNIFYLLEPFLVHRFNERDYDFDSEIRRLYVAVVLAIPVPEEHTHNNSWDLMDIFQHLNQSHLFTEESFHLVSQHKDAYEVATMLVLLKMAGKLTQNNFTHILDRDNRDALLMSVIEQLNHQKAIQFDVDAKELRLGPIAEMLKIIVGNHCLDLTLLDYFLQYNQRRDVRGYMKNLVRAKLVTWENVMLRFINASSVLFSHYDVDSKDYDLTQKRIDTFFKKEKCYVQALKILTDGRIDLLKYEEIVKDAVDPKDTAKAIVALQSAGLLTEADAKALAAVSCPHYKALQYEILQKAHLLSDSNKETLLQERYSYPELETMSFLADINLLDQVGFDYLVHISNRFHVQAYIDCLSCLKSVDILNANNVEKLQLYFKITEHDRPELTTFYDKIKRMREALKGLASVEQLTQAYFTEILAIPSLELESFTKIIVQLVKYGLHSRSNVDALKARPGGWRQFCKVFNNIDVAQLFSPKGF